MTGLDPVVGGFSQASWSPKWLHGQYSYLYMDSTLTRTWTVLLLVLVRALYTVRYTLGNAARCRVDLSVFGPLLSTLHAR